MTTKKCPTSLLLLSALIFAAALTTNAHAEDEEAEIVVSCYYSNGEWGVEMVDVCVKENHAFRAEVLAYPAEHKAVVEHCRKGSSRGWKWVKNCVDKDIAAATALSQYGPELKQLIDVCEFEWRGAGAARVKSCVDRHVEAQKKTQ